MVYNLGQNNCSNCSITSTPTALQEINSAVEFTLGCLQKHTSRCWTSGLTLQGKQIIKGFIKLKTYCIMPVNASQLFKQTVKEFLKK